MAQTTFLVSFLFGLLLVVTVAVVARQGWRHYTPGGRRGGTAQVASRLATVAESPVAWTVGFVVMAVGFGVGTLLFLSDAVAPALKQGVLGALTVGAVVVFVGYVFYGTFISARGRGLQNAQAVAVASWALGLLFTVAVVGRLMGVL